MSQYASVLDFETIGLKIAALQNVKDNNVTEFLIKTSGIIDSYLRANHTLPLTGALGPPNTFPPEIIAATVCIARYKLMVWRGFAPDELDTNLRDSFEDCMAWLRDLAKGVAYLDAGDDATVEYEARPRVDTKPQRGWLELLDEANS